MEDILKQKVLGQIPEIKTAQLKDKAGAVGASVLIMEEIFHRPISFLDKILTIN